ncbi:MAG: hypothetical protein AAGF11_46600 [Myxococcota bacterium]
MKAWDYRLLVPVCLPFALMACPTDPVPVEDDDSSGSSSTAMGSSTTLPTPADSSTGDPPMTTAMSSSSGPGTSGTTEASTGSTTVDPTTGEIQICGNNIIEGDEVCDLNQLNGETCASLGNQGGVLGCLLTCEGYNTLGCFICGNEVIDLMEDCEGGFVPEDVTCPSLGYEAGTVTCGDDCMWDVSDCSICGDGIQSGPEDCDGIDFGGQTCMSIGFDGGNLGCNLAQCQFVYSGCEGGFYFQDFELGPPVPMEFTVGVSNPWFIDDANPIDGLYSARSGALVAGGSTNLDLTADFPANGTISFDYLTSCDTGFDFLEFRIDGVLDMQWTGVAPLNSHMANVGPGMHTFQWRFNRQNFGNEGLDAVFVDNIQLDGGVPN